MKRAFILTVLVCSASCASMERVNWKDVLLTTIEALRPVVETAIQQAMDGGLEANVSRDPSDASVSEVSTDR